MRRTQRLFLALGAAGAISLGTLMPVVAATIPSDPAPIVQWRGQESGGHGAEDDAEGATRDVTPVLLWSLAGIGAGAVVMATLYLLKRQVGGFPENPTWVAPITIMPSRENSTDDTWGTGGNGHGHGDPQGAHH